jgi:hypothetical protein
MNKILMIAIAMFAMLGACKKSDPTVKNIANSGLVGNWIFTKMNQANGLYIIDGVQEGTYTATSSLPLGGLNLNTDGSYTGNVGYSYQLISVLGGNTSNDDVLIPQTNSSGTFSFDPATKKITFVGGSQAGVYQLISVSNNQLVMSIDVSATQVDASSGITITSSNTSTFYFNK